MPRPASLGSTAIWLLGALLILFVAGALARALLQGRPAGPGAGVPGRELVASLWLTALTATSATVCSLTMGVPLAYLLARVPFPGRRVVAGLVELPGVVPHPVAGIALLLFLGRQSPLGRGLAALGLEFVSHVPGIVAGMLFVSAPIAVRAARAGLRRVALPPAGRSILAGAVLAWARSVSEFGSIVILTYNPKVASILIYDRFTLFGLPAAVPAAVVLLLLALVVFVVVQLLAPDGGARR